MTKPCQRVLTVGEEFNADATRGSYHYVKFALFGWDKVLQVECKPQVRNRCSSLSGLDDLRWLTLAAWKKSLNKNAIGTVLVTRLSDLLPEFELLTRTDGEPLSQRNVNMVLTKLHAKIFPIAHGR